MVPALLVFEGLLGQLLVVDDDVELAGRVASHVPRRNVRGVLFDRQIDDLGELVERALLALW